MCNKLLFFLGILLFSQWGFSCSKPMTFLFGPLFSPTYVNLNFSDVHKYIYSKLECDIETTIAENSDDYFNRIKKKSFDLVLISSIHLTEIEKSGYLHLASGFGPNEIVLITSKRSGIRQPKDLEGKTVLLNSDISIPAVVWRQYAKKHDLAGKVRYGYPANLDSLIYELVKNKGDAAVTYIGFYNRLPPNLKHKLSVFHRKKMKHPGVIVVSESVPNDIRKRLKAAYTRSGKWERDRPKLDVQADSIVDKKLKALLQTN